MCNAWILRGPGPRFNIRISSYQYRKSHCGDKMVVGSSYLHNGISFTGKTSLSQSQTYHPGANYTSDVITSVMASQITGVTIVCSTVSSGADQRKHQRSTLLAFVRGIHGWPVNFPHKGLVARKMFPFDDANMFFHHNSNSMAIGFYSINSIARCHIATNFRSCPNSTTVVQYAKLHSDFLTTIWIRTWNSEDS